MKAINSVLVQLHIKYYIPIEILEIHLYRTPPQNKY